MKKPLLLFLILATICTSSSNAQQVNIDGRLKPLLDNFFELCKSYNIEYNDKLFALKKIAVVDDLNTSQRGSTLGMLQRDEFKNVENIVVNWIAMLDPEILRVVAFHEFGHYFLEYDTHVCDDCGIIMSVVNSSYFEIANDWENQIKILFEQSPVYLRNQNSIATKVAQAYPMN
ncbi:hypothetical protein [Ulvibacter antarcticus]|uniref:Uncharacterized protein n=1 Tax=Ulvibacter antarcticus TaxID=442714 RepID=A0A3L9YDV7_9FLAO|nr:hypothetical protein [Ulvibacter antarcticus]RMA58883.1 hypothetical protein BXY75_2264 [Ulvibacter antarcticus]